MKVVLNSLRPQDRFTIITFDGNVEMSATRDATKENVKSAIHFVEKIDASGGGMLLFSIYFTFLFFCPLWASNLEPQIRWQRFEPLGHVDYKK